MKDLLINKRFKEQSSHIRPKRFIILGDLHFGIHCNNNEWYMNIVDFFQSWFMPKLAEIAREGDVIVCTGDVNDSNSVVRTEIMDGQMTIFERMSEVLPVVNIIGNHDIVRKYTNDINSVRPLGKDPNIFVYPRQCTWETAYGEKILFMPWNQSPEDERQIVEGTDAEYLVSHSHYNGLFFNDEFIYKEGDEPSSLSIEELSKFKRVINGHIHKRQVIDNLLNVGTPYHTKFEDAGNECGIHVLDLKDNTFEFIENHYSPKYKEHDIWQVLEMDTEEAQESFNNSYNYVRHPSRLGSLLELNRIRKVLGGYRDIKFVPFVEKVKKEFMRHMEMEREAEMPSTIDVSGKIPDYVDTLTIDGGLKSRLKEDLKNLYDRAYNKVKDFDELEMAENLKEMNT